MCHYLIKQVLCTYTSSYIFVIGFPTITVAPDCESDSELPVHRRPDPPTQLSLLSQSMMDQQVLSHEHRLELLHCNKTRAVTIPRLKLEYLI